MTVEQQQVLEAYIESLSNVGWFDQAGQPDSTAIVAADLVKAWDGWNDDMMKAWSPATHALEEIAVQALGEGGVDFVFSKISTALGAALEAGIDQYLNRRTSDSENTNDDVEVSLWPDWLDSAKRDLCWGAIEAILNRPGFFTALLPYYRAGRWPCARVGGEATGQIVVL